MVTNLSIVIIEDHDDLRLLMVAFLQHHYSQVQGFSCIEDLDENLSYDQVDMFVVDLNLPGEDGLSFVKRMREAFPKTGLIMLTAKGLLADKITGYEVGADIYLVKPLAPEELLSAIHALSRRISVHAGEEFHVELRQKKLLGPLGSIALTRDEIAILTCFAKAKNHSLETWQLTELLSRDDVSVSKATLEVRMFRLRQKFVEVAGDIPSIRAIRLYGYELAVKLIIV